VPHIVITVLQLVMLGLGGWAVLRGRLSAGNLVAFYLLFVALCEHLWSLTATLPSLINASAAMRRVHEVLAQPVEDPAHDAEGRPFAGLGDGVRFEHVSFSYDGARDQLSDVSLALRPGERVAFVGGSGSGKSTALRLLLGLHAPRTGRILVGDTDLAEIARVDYWAHASAVFQDSLLFHASIAENIRAGRLDATPADIERAAAAAEIDDWVRTLPEGFDTVVSADTCSGGQRQRIALARALVRDPALLVLDEPTSALDPPTAAAVMQTLRRAAAGRTAVLVTHQLHDAADAARIVVFDAGRVAEIGTHAELLARRGAYAELWAKQRGQPEAAALGAQ
jgi:ATP-binding cassette subfamily B protein